MSYTVAGESLGVSPIRYVIFCALTYQVGVDFSITFFRKGLVQLPCPLACTACLP